MENIGKRINQVSEWIMHLFLLQIYWIFGTLIGGIILGIIPSSIALFSSIRKLFRVNQEFKLLDYFVGEYKANFKFSLVLNLWYILIFIVSFIYREYMSATTDSWLAYTHIPLYALLLLLILLSLYLIPVYVHYEVRPVHLIPTTGAIMLTSMKWNLPLLLSLIAVALIFIRFSVVFLFFGISLPAFILFYFTHLAFNDFDLKRDAL